MHMKDICEIMNKKTVACSHQERDIGLVTNRLIATCYIHQVPLPDIAVSTCVGVEVVQRTHHEDPIPFRYGSAGYQDKGVWVRAPAEVHTSL